LQVEQLYENITIQCNNLKNSDFFNSVVLWNVNPIAIQNFVASRNGIASVIYKKSIDTCYLMAINFYI
jgi:hypothetical protein